MSNRTFLVVVGTILVVLIGSMIIQKFEQCLEHGGKACPLTRYGRSMDPYQRAPVVQQLSTQDQP
jgi:hypothetical protein